MAIVMRTRTIRTGTSGQLQIPGELLSFDVSPVNNSDSDSITTILNLQPYRQYCVHSIRRSALVIFLLDL